MDADVSIKFAEELRIVGGAAADAAEALDDANWDHIGRQNKSYSLGSGDSFWAWQQGIDAKSGEETVMAGCLRSLAAVEAAEIFTPPRCTMKAYL